MFNNETYELVLLDQTKIPYELRSWSTNDWVKASIEGIRGMVVRGSQAIGVAGGYCTVLACNSITEQNVDDAKRELYERAEKIKQSRPTAVNLSWAVNRIIQEVKNTDITTFNELKDLVLNIANRIFMEDLILNTYLRLNGEAFIESGDVILTHCNAGSLATAYGGSAISVLAEAFVKGKDITVVSKETRPRSQGFKITLWELNKIGIPTVAITDNMISASISKFKINKVLVGADRITKDGYVTNKIGTYDIARIVKQENIPFYVAASHSTLDLDNLGPQIPIEERDIDEMRRFYNFESLFLREQGILSEKAIQSWPPNSILSKQDVPKRGEIKIYNPAFDTTPSSLITKIIMDIGVFTPTEIQKLSWEKIYSVIGSLKSTFKV
ncbi:MAG: S-methyl-5-thioribose-1-phosphate isomerase [Candidatus Odinarchaeia archaeon]